MPYVYVYSPFTGQIWGKENYCNGTVHTVVASLGGCCPIDIGGDENRIVKFYGSSNVKSIKTTRVSNICASQTGYWNEGVVVDFYADYNGQCYMGRVGYGHLKDRVSNGIYNVREKELGKLPPDCSCSCSDGIHIHMQCVDGTLTSLQACSGVWAYAGSSWIYRWYWPYGGCS